MSKYEPLPKVSQGWTTTLTQKPLRKERTLAMPETQHEQSKLCLHCQKCCQVMVFDIPLPIGREKIALAASTIFYRSRGCEVVIADGRPYVVIPFPCPNLTTFGCKIYPSRPGVCRTYSGLNDPVMRDQCAWQSLFPSLEKTS